MISSSCLITHSYGASRSESERPSEFSEEKSEQNSFITHSRRDPQAGWLCSLSLLRRSPWTWLLIGGRRNRPAHPAAGLARSTMSIMA